MLKESLFREEMLNISIDSESFQKFLCNENINAENILKHIIHPFNNKKCYELIRTPLESEIHELLTKIPYFTIEEKKDSYLRYMEHDISSLYVHRPDSISEHPNNLKSCFSIRFTEKMAIEFGKELFDKNRLNEKEKNAAFLMFIQFYLMSNEKIFITENPLILKNRPKFYYMSEKPPLIVNLQGGKEVIGLYLRYKNNYNIYFHDAEWYNIKVSFEKHKYYEYYLLSQVPYLPFKDDDSENHAKSLVSRFLNLFVSLDQIGIQYHNGVNKDSVFDSLYHFNYLITIITGIFDSLALITKNKYDIITKNDIQITLNPKSENIIRKRLKTLNYPLYKHLIEYSTFIGFMHKLRNVIIHNEMLEKGVFHISQDVGFKGVMIPKELFEKLKHHPQDIRDKNKKKIFWGVLSTDQDQNGYVDLFKFSKASSIEIINFTNTYMELIGQNNIINMLREEKSPYLERFDLLNKYNFDLDLAKNSD